MPLYAVDRNDSTDTLTLKWALASPPIQVWNHLSDPAKLPEWLGTARTFDIRRGGCIEVDHDDGHICRSEIRSFFPARSIGLTWQFPDEPMTLVSLHTSVDGDRDETPNTTGVDAEDNAGTLLTLHHSGLGELKDSYASGWLSHLTCFEASLHGLPLPTQTFRSLAASFDSLYRNLQSAPDRHHLGG